MKDAKPYDNSLSSFKAYDVLKLTIWAENQFIRDTIEAAAKERRVICEFDSMTVEIEAELKDSGFKVNRVEMMGGAKVIVKWA